MIVENPDCTKARNYYIALNQVASAEVHRKLMNRSLRKKLKKIRKMNPASEDWFDWVRPGGSKFMHIRDEEQRAWLRSLKNQGARFLADLFF